MTLPDVQALRSVHNYKLTRVGVTRIRKPIRVRRPESDEPVTLVATFDVTVDLPAEQRGSHMSRNIEAINEIIDRAVRAPTRGLEDLAAELVSELLERHEYASQAEVEIATQYFRNRTTPRGARSLEETGLTARATAERDGPARKAIGVSVTGMSACPCAMEGTRALLEAEGVVVPEGMPSVTHNQRNTTVLMVETEAGNGDVEANDLADIVEASLSSPTYEYLKRGDEAQLVLNAHRRPRFVEDIVREVLDRVLKTYGHLPDDAVVLVRSEARESIHKHDAMAERVTTLGELRA